MLGLIIYYSLFHSFPLVMTSIIMCRHKLIFLTINCVVFIHWSLFHRWFSTAIKILFDWLWFIFVQMTMVILIIRITTILFSWKKQWFKNRDCRPGDCLNVYYVGTHIKSKFNYEKTQSLKYETNIFSLNFLSSCYLFHFTGWFHIEKISWVGTTRL